MIISLYSVNDTVNNSFGSPTLQNNDAAAMRSFGEVFNDVYSPEDYSLWKIGEFDMTTGELIPITPYIVCRATDFRKEKKKNAKK